MNAALDIYPEPMKLARTAEILLRDDYGLLCNVTAGNRTQPHRDLHVRITPWLRTKELGAKPAIILVAPCSFHSDAKTLAAIIVHFYADWVTDPRARGAELEGLLLSQPNHAPVAAT